MSAPGPDRPWARRADDVLDALATSEDGLGEDDARARLDENGPNELPQQAAESPLDVLLRQIKQPLIYVLLGAVVVSAAIGHWVDAGVIAAVVAINAVIGFVQEYRASREMEALLALVGDTSVVRRDGEEREIDSRELVPGDVIVIEAGERVPADARLLRVEGLRVDEATLTGESAPVDKSAADGLDEDTALADRENMLFSGTTVVEGRARAVVVATAGATELARVSEMVGAAEEIATPLTRRIAAFSRKVTWVILAVAGVTFTIAELRGYGTADAFLAAVALAVAAIPEGLPAIMTIALALGVRVMATRNSIVRRLPAVEALGSTTVICSDKTGTLTRSEMVVREVFTGEVTGLTGDGYEPDGRFVLDGDEHEDAPELVSRALRAGLLCSDARLVDGEDGHGVEGDPTEGAIVVAAAKAGLSREDAEGDEPRLDELPFESERRFMATLHRSGDDDRPRLLLKGAPEQVIQRCADQAWEGDWEPDALRDEAEAMASRGLRVLAVAEGAGPSAEDGIDEETVPDDLTLLALLGLLDPPREEALAAVEACQEAGVRVVMITGDHPRTAAAIAGMMGIADDGEALTGRDLDAMSDDDRRQAARDVSVFARVAPEHKLMLVRMLQEDGETVAVTGDGVNDAPALKQGDIGVAMGITGTDVSQEASDIVLRDDNFATIRAAVEEGRRVFDNLVKSIVFILPTSAGESLLVLGVIALGLTLPLVPVQVLWINTITTVALALPLALEAAERDLMRRAPRAPDTPVLGREGVVRIVLVALVMFGAGLAVFEIAEDAGATTDEARTAVVTFIVLLESIYLLMCRSLRGSVAEVGLWSNPWVYAGIAVVLALQAAFVYVPFMNDLFDSAAIDAGQWLTAAFFAAAVVPVVAAHKRWSRVRGR